jgi:hypothetical protein
MAEAHARMMCLGIVSLSLFERFFPIEYEKLCYAIGHYLDTTLTTPWHSVVLPLCIHGPSFERKH